MQAKPQKEHEWLHKLIGDWSFESECIMGPDQPAVKFGGTESVRSLGGLWVLCEGQGESPEGISQSIMTLGYDPAKKRYVGTFIASMMTYLWVYDGALDPEGLVLTLDAEGPSFTAEGKIVKYKDVIEFKSDDHRVLSSHTPGDAGQWHCFMTAHYRRVT
jgi:hypothetical protein